MDCLSVLSLHSLMNFDLSELFSSPSPSRKKTLNHLIAKILNSSIFLSLQKDTDWVWELSRKLGLTRCINWEGRFAGLHLALFITITAELGIRTGILAKCLCIGGKKWAGMKERKGLKLLLKSNYSLSPEMLWKTEYHHL